MAKEEKAKKPFYKKWWFWLIVVIVCVAVFGSSAEEKNNTNNKEQAKQEKTEKVEKVDTATTNKTSVKIDGNTFKMPNGLEFTVTEAKVYDGAEEGTKVLQFKADFKNTSKKEIALIGEPYAYVHAYQKIDGNETNLDPGVLSYEVTSNDQDLAKRSENMSSVKVAPGNTAQGEFGFTLKDNSDVTVTLMNSGFKVVDKKVYKVN